MQVAEVQHTPVLEVREENITHQSTNSVPRIFSNPNPPARINELPPLGTQQQYFAFGEGSRTFLESTQEDRSLQKWSWIFAGLALASICTMALAIWQFSSGV